MISTASRVGTGNIIGVSTAIAVGGPGAVFWMWLMALLGAASAFCESTLAQIYKIKSGDKFLGGPAYYIQRGLGKKGLGVLYAVLLIICSSTAMILLVSGVEGNAANAGSPYMQQAVFHMFGETGIHIVTVALMLFAFTTLLGNYFYAEQNLKFITENSKALFVFRIVALVIIFIGTHVGFEMAWNITDILMALVAIVNILAVFAMRRPVIAALKNYDKARKTTDEPVFRAADIGLTDTDCWK